MSVISVKNLTFAYDGSYVNVFENASFDLDTDWKLGLVGRNGRGKTTLLKILSGELEYRGNIVSPVNMEYFSCSLPDTPAGGKSVTALDFVKSRIAPFSEWERQMEMLLLSGSDEDMEKYSKIYEMYSSLDGYIIDELIRKEAGLLKIPEDALDRPAATLSGGEITKLSIGAMFLRRSSFRLIDEPTNHLDYHGRLSLAEYLSGRQGFIVISHDRAFLDFATDHTISINRENIEIIKGNYSVWKEHRDKRDAYEISENERLKKDIVRLKESAARASGYAGAAEGEKKGAADKGFFGHKAAKVMKRAKNIERRLNASVQEKTELLKNIEQAETLRLNCIPYHSKKLIEADRLSAGYDSGKLLFEEVSFTVEEGDRVRLSGGNGAGKSTLIKLILGENLPHTGKIRAGASLTVSYVPQDTSFLKGTIEDFIRARNNIDKSLYMAVLRKLDFTRSQFGVRLEDMSSGQKKKILLSASICEEANLYIWDEPLNFIDIISREQIEDLIINHRPTIIFVEHDAAFSEKTATKTIELRRRKL